MLTKELKKTSQTNLTAWLILILLALIWGSSFILVKKSLTVFSPVQVASIRITAGILCLTGFIIFSLKFITRDKWKFLLASGLMGNFLPAFLFAFAQLGLSSSLTGVLNSLTPFFTFIFGILFFGQRGTLSKAIGILLGLSGSVALVMISSEGGKFQFNFYALFVVGATVLYGMNVNFVKKYLSTLKSAHITSISLFTMIPFALISLFFADIPTTYQANEGSFWAMIAAIILGITGTGIAMLFFNKLLQISTAIFASSVTYLIPIVAILWGIIDGEQLFLSHYLCMAVIITGVWLVNKKS